MKYTKILKLYILFVLIALIFGLYINYRYKNTELGYYKWDKIIELQENFEYINADGSTTAVKLPLTVPMVEGNTYQLVFTLPDTYPEGSVLCFKSNHLLVDAYIADQLVYQLNVDGRNTIGKSPGCLYSFVPLSVDDYGKKVRIEYTAVYKQASFHINKLLLGERTTIITGLIRGDFGAVLISMLLIAFGILCIVYSIINNKGIKKEGNLIFVGMFTILVALWAGMETQIMQFFFTNVYALQYVTYLSLGLLTVPVLLYYVKKHRINNLKLVNIIIIYSLGSFCFGFLLQCIGAKDFPETVILTHISILLAAIYIGYESLKSFYICFTNKKAQKQSLYEEGQKDQLQSAFHESACVEKPVVATNIGTLILIGCIGVDIIRYYLKVQSDYARYVRIGLLIYCICITLELMLKSMNARNVISKLEDIAYIDRSTGALNENAYQGKLEQLKQYEGQYNVLGIAKFKIMGLKDAEYRYGSVAKKELIETAAKLLQLSFQYIAYCYRIGEGEFAIIMEDFKAGEEMQGFSYLESRIYNCNKSREHKIRLAYGFEKMYETDGIDISYMITCVDNALEKECSDVQFGG